MMKKGYSDYLIAILAMALSFLMPPISTSAAAACTFVLGFQTIHDQIADTVGDCTVDQHYNNANGDALQETAGGLLVWRKADNFTAFTDGYWSWVNGPFGLQKRLNTERFEWEPALPEPQAVATPSPLPATTLTATPTATPVPQSYNYYVLPRVGSPIVLGGTQLVSARLTIPDNYGAPPVVGAMATFTYRGLSFDVPTGADGWATAIVSAPPGGGCFNVVINYNGHTYGVPGWEDGNRCWK